MKHAYNTVEVSIGALAAVLFGAWLMWAGLAFIYPDAPLSQVCTTDSECAALCAEDDVDCDGGPQ
jgi:hypothetical protein